MIQKYASVLCAFFSLLIVASPNANPASKVRTLGYIDNTNDAISVDFSPNGEILADAVTYLKTTGTKTQSLGAVRLWNVKSGKLLRALKPFGEVRSVRFSPNGKMLAAGLELGTGHTARGQVIVWNTRNWKQIAEIKVAQAHVYSVAFTPDGKFIAAGCGDSRVRLWNWKQNKITRTLLSSIGAITSLTISRNGLYVAAGSKYASGKAVQLWEISSGRLLHTWALQGVLAISPDSKTVASAERKRPSEPYTLINFWSIKTGKLQNTLKSRTTEKAEALAYSPDGRYLAISADEGKSQIWDISRKKTLQEFETTADEEITFAPNGKLIAEAGYASATYLHPISVK